MNEGMHEVMKENAMYKTENDMDNGMFALTNAMPHCPVILVLDTSHSMWGQGLCDMMASLKAFYKTIADVQFLNAQVDITAVSMGENLCILEKFTPLHSSDLPDRSIRPKGDTPIGAALELAQEALQAQIGRYHSAGISYVTPNLILLSDGKSTDDFQTAAEHVRSSVKAGKLICHAIALGKDADMEALSSIAGRDRVIIPNFGGMRQTFTRIGQIVSETYEEEAQEVIIEQATPVEKHDGAEYLLDGSNILHWDEYRTGVSLKYLLAITDHLKKENQTFQVLFDATAPHILRKKAPQESDLYESLLKDDPGHFCQVPAGTRADDFLLLQADANRNALILTQDLFRDHVDKYPWLKTEKRVIPGMVMNDVIFFPEISLLISTSSSEKETINSL